MSCLIDITTIEPFASLARSVQPFTFLGPDRLYTLWQAIAGMPAQADAVAEVGAYRGGSARFLAEALRAHQRDLPLEVCDTFRGHVVVDESLDGRHAVGRQFIHVNVDHVRAYLREFPNVRVIEGDIRETQTECTGQRYGCVHLDVDVYPITRLCLERFGPRMIPGGTIVVDDYGKLTCRGVTTAVDEFAAAHPGFRRWHLLTGQALLTAVDSTERMDDGSTYRAARDTGPSPRV